MANYSPPTPYAPLSGQVTTATGLQFVYDVLTNLAKQYRPHGFLYDQIATPFQVDHNLGQYPVFDPSYFFSAGGNLQVADDAPTPILDTQWSKDQYQCLDYRLQARITRKETLQAHTALRLEYSKTIQILTSFALNREMRLAAKLSINTNTDPYTGFVGQLINQASAPSVKWDAGTSGSPATIQKDLQSAARTAYLTSGIWPNTLVIDKQIALAIAADPTIINTIQYLVGVQQVAQGGGAGQTLDPTGGFGILPPTLFGFRVLVADGALYNTARPGQTASLASVWGNNARLVYTQPNMQWGMPATAYAFRGKVAGGIAQPPSTIMPGSDGGQEPGPAGQWAVVERWYDMDPPVIHIRAWECVDEKIVAPETGIIIPNVLTTFT